jgi:hypothetical protein
VYYFGKASTNGDAFVYFPISKSSPWAMYFKTE